MQAVWGRRKGRSALPEVALIMRREQCSASDTLRLLLASAR